MQPSGTSTNRTEPPLRKSVLAVPRPSTTDTLALIIRRRRTGRSGTASALALGDIGEISFAFKQRIVGRCLPNCSRVSSRRSVILAGTAFDRRRGARGHSHQRSRPQGHRRHRHRSNRRLSCRDGIVTGACDNAVVPARRSDHRSGPAVIRSSPAPADLASPSPALIVPARAGHDHRRASLDVTVPLPLPASIISSVPSLAEMGGI